MKLKFLGNPGVAVAPTLHDALAPLSIVCDKSLEVVAFHTAEVDRKSKTIATLKSEIALHQVEADNAQLIADNIHKITSLELASVIPH